MIQLKENSKCEMYGLLPSFAVIFLCNSCELQFLLCNSGHGLRAMLSPKHVGQMLQVVNFRHVSFSFGEHPETTAS